MTIVCEFCGVYFSPLARVIVAEIKEGRPLICGGCRGELRVQSQKEEENFRRVGGRVHTDIWNSDMLGGDERFI